MELMKSWKASAKLLRGKAKHTEIETGRERICGKEEIVAVNEEKSCQSSKE